MGGMAEQQSTTTGPQAAPERPRLVRVPEGLLVAGVCTGLGRYLGVDPVVLRVGFAVLLLANGQGLLLYLAAYLLMPPAPQALAPAEQMLRRRFDAGTVLVLLGGLLGLLTMVVTAGRPLSGDALAGVTVLALVLLVAHARKVDFAQLARDLPERLQGQPVSPDAPAPPEGRVSLNKRVSLVKDVPAAAGRPADPPAGGVTDDPAAPGGRSCWSRPPDAPADPGGEPKRGCGRHSALTSVVLLSAMMAAAAMIPVALHGDHGIYGGHLVAAPALAVIGLGLLIGGWAGRPSGLATVGTVLTLGLLTSTAVAETPKGTRFGNVEWRPADASRTEQTYRLGVGSGRLDLTALPLSAGRRIRVNAEVLSGKLTITVPGRARVELDGRIALGDLTVNSRLDGGPFVQVERVLEPRSAGEGDPPVIELRVRVKVGDVEVRHV